MRAAGVVGGGMARFQRIGGKGRGGGDGEIAWKE